MIPRFLAHSEASLLADFIQKQAVSWVNAGRFDWYKYSAMDAGCLNERCS